MPTIRAGAAPVSNILSGSYTVDTLPLASEAMLGKYARVTDLFGEKTDLVLCAKSGAMLYWQPVRPVYAKTMTADSNRALHPLKTPSVLFLTGNVTSNRTYALDDALAWPGAMFEVAMEGTFNALTTLNIAGTGLGSGLGVLLGQRRRVMFDGAAWRQFT